ncbi:MAG: response regulator transcription factor [Thermodesulfobacteriota bacterium]
MTDSEALVFVVDDDDSVRKALARLMRSVGLHVETFRSAGEFLGREPHPGPACLILDVRMPDLSGLDLQKELAASGTTLPVIFITGHGTVPMSVQAMKAGAVEFLEKPFDDQTLIDAVHEALKKDQQARLKKAELREIHERVCSLTPREREIFGLVVSGKLNKQIAFELGTSEKTVKAQRSQIMKKMRADSLADLVRLAVKVGITTSVDQAS